MTASLVAICIYLVGLVLRCALPGGTTRVQQITYIQDEVRTIGSGVALLGLALLGSASVNPTSFLRSRLSPNGIFVAWTLGAIGYFASIAATRWLRNARIWYRANPPAQGQVGAFQWHNALKILAAHYLGLLVLILGMWFSSTTGGTP